MMFCLHAVHDVYKLLFFNPHHSFFIFDHTCMILYAYIDIYLCYMPE